MTTDEARAICQRFANEHKVVFEDHGECGFGRPCVGFLYGGNYVDIHPRDSSDDYEELWPHDTRVNAPTGVEAYHKHDCLAVLALGDEPDYEKAIQELAQWVEHLESHGAVEVATFKTGASGLQAIISGVFGHALRFRETVAK